jgi:flagellar L-ring protein precursor FlgH
MRISRTNIALILLALAPSLRAQSSSLYVDDTGVQPPPPLTMVAGQAPPDRLSPAIARMSLAAVRLPEQHKFALQDLITIVIRESTESDSSSNLDTKKESNYDAAITSFPNLNLGELLQGQLNGSTLTNPPKVAINSKKDFKADGEAKRSDTFTSRVTARIIDVKPNGTLVLESRKFIKTDDESLELILTGTCRKEDVTIDNTVLSTQIYDLHLIKNHTGELRKGTKKGWLTKLFDGIVGF